MLIGLPLQSPQGALQISGGGIKPSQAVIARQILFAALPGKNKNLFISNSTLNFHSFNVYQQSAISNQ